MINRAALRSFRTVKPVALGPIQQRAKGSVAENTKEVLNNINLKVGQTLASGLGKAEEAAQTASEATGKVSEQVSEKASKAKDDLSNLTKDAKDAANREVKENIKGYDSLQDKGSNVEREQQRPDDGV
ncbi:hypothetical protein OGAPHI_006452 [Ogataea philodendri]|uniref:Uncharacterized protein n=1 Tax=Ogataea philodendri TaxID=1378263 RepID=A0A9P8NYX7_9ASCO|nr:uncharacterized protein OGAPHI_006452 [Ogataea philodendri]KAH3661604.1 hypothetical protein OGAPHI_006452 [Ogataea philodendri]